MAAFDGTLEAAGGGGAFVEIPADALAALGAAKRAQTRERRLVKAIAMLRAGVKHP
jgi:hypothetical protein